MSILMGMFVFFLVIFVKKDIVLIGTAVQAQGPSILFSVPRGVGLRTDTGIYFIFYYLFEWIRSKSAPMVRTVIL